MFTQSSNYKKLSFYITIAFLILGLSVLSTMPAQARPVKKFIGPEGGEIDTNHNNSYLIVPEGAMGNEAAALDALDNAIAILEIQYAYIDGLSTVEDDPSDEWVKAGRGGKDATLKKSKAVKDKSNKSKQKRAEGKAKEAKNEAKNSLNELDKLQEHLVKLLSDGKIGAVAHDNVQAQNDQIEGELAFAESQLGEEFSADCFEVVITFDDVDYEVLIFEFGPHGTQFLVSVELVIPWDDIIYSDGLFWYSEGSGETIDLIDMDYWIDDVNETVHFFIDHFSQYYYSRR